MIPIKSIDINCDMGELIDGHLNYDVEIIPYISSCNISCGFHSGHPVLIDQTIKNAIDNNINIGAHPSYDDKENFGRRSIDIPISQLQSQIKYQVSALKGMVESNGSTLHHVKPHGALYNDMHKNEQLARVIIEALQAIDKELIIYIMTGSPIIKVCNEMNIGYKEEVFADRAYVNIHTLQSRKIEGAVISNIDKILKRIDDITMSKITDIHDHTIEINPDTICIHSDTPDAPAIAKSIFHHLSNKNIDISKHR